MRAMPREKDRTHLISVLLIDVRESHLPHKQEYKLALRANTDLMSY